ncbi:heterokaryon incompatibility protein-domain-containing protein [Pyrenochaeta sp. MPI-SDFR-AT-0127]|nr:heterokaryon incompatibility protein-domain-containing protein [Pyrenochaeta sp. MPI-SDFR-AT-0127]
MLPDYGEPRNLCGRCSKINLGDPIRLSQLQAGADSCSLCNMLSRCLKRHSVREQQEIQLLESRHVVRICTAQRAKPNLQLGFPVLPEARGLIHFELLREWLQFCDHDTNHQRFGCGRNSNTVLPTRVVDVSNDKGPDFLSLYCSKKREKGEYIALSHCWGKLKEEDKAKFCTSPSNFHDRCRGFNMNDLPQTFKDAVTVTRELGKRYLWIDSLCIIQDDPNDWAIESKRMEAVFSNAYCTIAASSAADSTVGFLRRRQLRQYIEVANSAQGRIYICEAIDDDFFHDVEESLLSRRAWVLQERALSRRTVYFTASQLYWECGDGVRSETLTHMRNSKSLFLSDPKFPETLEDRSEPAKIDLFETLFARYSQLGLTQSTDRSVAISGLEKRLADTFATQGRHGVFESYLHRSLLWERSEDTRMKRILYPTDRGVPSWSWMAYEGLIKYVPIPFSGVEWHKAVQLRGDVLEARVREFRSVQLEHKDGKYVIRDGTVSSEKWWLKYDGEDSADLQTLRVAVIGRENGRLGDGRRYYILVVKPQCLEECRTFERVAVGCIPERVISFESQEVYGKIF